MKLRRIGSFSVGEIGLGCMGMSQFFGARDDEESIKTIHRALELGVTLLDTAEGYGAGGNEELIARAIRGRREKVVISTKFSGARRTRDPDNRLTQAEYAPLACDASLERLGVDVIDIFSIHRVDPNDLIEDTIGALSRLVEAGKIREIGLSEAGIQTIRRAHAVHPIAALQNEYSLWTRDPEREVLPLCRELGISLVAYAPLGRGFFTGKVQSIDGLQDDDLRKTLPRFQGENFEHNKSLLETLSVLAAEVGCTPGQLSLAWLLAQSPQIIPIPGTKRRRWVEENVAASDISLSPAILQSLDEAFRQDAIAGARYPEWRMNRVGK